jgi:hypothetical protein
MVVGSLGIPPNGVPIQYVLDMLNNYSSTENQNNMLSSVGLNSREILTPLINYLDNNIPKGTIIEAEPSKFNGGDNEDFPNSFQVSIKKDSTS